jgi:hypothetical protein
MKTEEDEAFDELARKQGAWGGGFKAKQAMAADKMQEPMHCQCTACKDGILHASDCAVHNGPAYPAGPCDCGVAQKTEREALKLALEALETLMLERGSIYEQAITAIKEALAQPAQQEAIYGMNQDDWKDVVAAITKVRDGRGIYLGCRPADVFQDWFLALGTAKVKEKKHD